MKERDQRIIDLYRSGSPLKEISKRFKISQGRINQILRVAGVPRDRTGITDRNRFLGVNISSAVKDALKAEADRRGISVSELSSESLKEMLIECGYPLEAAKI